MQERLSRAQRRQLLKDDEPYIGRALDMDANGRGAQANTRHIALLLLDTAAHRRASRAAAFAGQLLDATLARHVPKPVACARGCAHCCHTYVSATIPEVLRVAHVVRANDPTRARVEAAAALCQKIPQTHREAHRITCPILVDNACSEYTSRPLVCRVVLSTSVNACIRIFRENADETFPHAANAMNVRTYFDIMFKTALVLAGLPHQHFDFHHAVQVALAHEDAEARWLAGDPVFENVTMDSAETKLSKLGKVVETMAANLRPTI